MMMVFLFSVALNAGEDSGPKMALVLEKLASASFKEKLLLVDEVVSAGSESEAVLKALLAGELYYKKSDKSTVLQVQLVADDQYRLVDLLVADQSTTVAKAKLRKEFKKIRVNNKLRQAIKISLAKLALLSANQDEQLTALDELMKNPSDLNAQLVRPLLEEQADGAVKEKMRILLALNRLESSRDKQDLLVAIKSLSGKLEPQVNNALKYFRENLPLEDEKQNAILASATDKALASIDSKRDSFHFIEKLFFGLSLGSVLLLAAIGLAITFGVMGVINMAHGEMIMLGAYTTYVVQLIMPNFINYSLFVAIPAAFLVSGLVGILIQRLVIRHLNGRPLETLLATFGISLILQQAVRSIFSPLNRQVASPDWMSGSLEINPILSLTYNRLYILAFSLLVFVVLVAIIKKTSLGLNVRAVSQNRDMAKAMGVKTEWVDAMTFGLGSGVAGVAGVALSQLTNVGPNLGQAYIIDSFMVVVFGGVGNLLGTMIGAFGLGIANKFMEPVTGAVLANILVLVFIILFIQKRPKGLFPQKGRSAE